MRNHAVCRFRQRRNDDIVLGRCINHLVAMKAGSTSGIFFKPPNTEFTPSGEFRPAREGDRVSNMPVKVVAETNDHHSNLVDKVHGVLAVTTDDGRF